MILDKRYKYYNKNTNKIEKIGKKCSVSNLKRTKMPEHMIDHYIRYSELPQGHKFFEYIMNAINGWLETHEPDKKIIFVSKKIDEFEGFKSISNGLCYLSFKEGTTKNVYQIRPVSFSYQKSIKHEYIERNYIYKGYFIVKASNEKELFNKLYILLELFTNEGKTLLKFLDHNEAGYEKINLCEVVNNEK